MIPLRDSVRSSTRPYVTWILIALNIYIFYRQFMLPVDMLNQVYLHFGVVPADLSYALANGTSLVPVLLTLITAMFLHGGWVHVLGNMLYLWVFGDNVEDRLGHLRYLLFYLASGVAGGIAHFLSNPASQVPIIGASGAIAGILGAYLIAFPRSRVLTLLPIFIFFTIVEIPAVIFLAIWFVLQLFNGAASIGGTANTVAWWAHVGGFVAGAIMIKLLPARRRDNYYYSRE